MITLAALHIYPVKSLGGLSLTRAEMTDRGLAGDRRFAVVDASGKFLSQRTLPRMALVRTALDDTTLTLSAPGAPDLHMSRLPDGPALEVQVWGDRMRAISAGDAASRWLSSFLAAPCALVHMPDSTLRPSSPSHPPSTPVSFADGFPYLLTTQASLAELARRGADVPMDRFRPNLVLDGTAPFAEDHWSSFHLGPAHFHLVKPCARCVITTIDQSTAAPSKEPLATLATFRRQGPDVLFGWNLTATSLATISVGDTISLVTPRT